MMLVWNNLADPHLSAFSDFARFSQTLTLNCDKQVYHSLNTHKLDWGELGLYCQRHRDAPQKPPKRVGVKSQ